MKKTELQLKVSLDAQAHQQQIYDKAKGQVDALPKDDGTLQHKRAELQREVDTTKRGLQQQVICDSEGKLAVRKI